jgi:hypothetical protein
MRRYGTGPTYHLAVVPVGLGEKEKALVVLEAASQEHSDVLVKLKNGSGLSHDTLLSWNGLRRKGDV